MKKENVTKSELEINSGHMKLVLDGTPACLIRDSLMKARAKKEITLKEITNSLSKISIPDWLQSQILQMSNYRKWDRITCPVEQAMEAAVHFHLLNNIMSERN